MPNSNAGKIISIGVGFLGIVLSQLMHYDPSVTIVVGTLGLLLLLYGVRTGIAAAINRIARDFWNEITTQPAITPDSSWRDIARVLRAVVLLVAAPAFVMPSAHTYASLGIAAGERWWIRSNWRVVSDSEGRCDDAARRRALERLAKVGHPMREAKLTCAAINGIVLTDANLMGASLDSTRMRGAVLSNADLRTADLRHADLQNVVLVGADLRWADLRGAQLYNAILDSADLRGARLDDAQLLNASLIGARLDEASLGNADLSFAHLNGASLSRTYVGGANFQVADLREAHFNVRLRRFSSTFLDVPVPADSAFIGSLAGANAYAMTPDSRRSWARRFMAVEIADTEEWYKWRRELLFLDEIRMRPDSIPRSWHRVLITCPSELFERLPTTFTLRVDCGALAPADPDLFPWDLEPPAVRLSGSVLAR